MGIHRASLYDTYGSKEQLFREVLSSYEEVVRTRYAGLLEGPGRARDVLREFFRRAVEDLTADKSGPCLMLQTALSGARNLQEVPLEVRRHYDWFASHFERLLARGRAEGDVRTRSTDAELAGWLRQVLLGVLAAAAVDGDGERIQSHVDRELKLLLHDG
jgi:TetR/AcrR family transcriptional repressor of nem operon